MGRFMRNPIGSVLCDRGSLARGHAAALFGFPPGDPHPIPRLNVFPVTKAFDDARPRCGHCAAGDGRRAF